MIDATEPIRRIQQAQVNADPRSTEEIAKDEGPTWTTDQLTEEFEVLSFLAPYVSVRRKSDGVKGTMLFRHSPRVYYGFEAS